MIIGYNAPCIIVNTNPKIRLHIHKMCAAIHDKCHKKMTRTIIFDFDGTVANTLDAVVRIVNEHSEYFGYGKVTKQDIPYLQGKKPREILSYLGISIFKLPSWVKKIHSEINKEITNMTPTTNISPLLSDLYDDEDVHLGILTSNTQENVRQFLEKNELNFFEFIRTGKSVFGKSRLINKIIKQRRLKRDNTFYVCDEIRDIEAARKSGIISVAVTWVYNTEASLAKENPDFLATTSEELRKILMPQL
ncbi:HAD hydrolase-like protein [archaeon]|nr:HAD hydrolase-like protein [archaeon]